MKISLCPHRRELLDPKEGKTANWLTSMKSSHVDTFSRDSDPMREARAHYFATHSRDWAHSNSEDLSNIFRELAKETGLLGESIFEIQWSWKGPDHLKQANYVFSFSTQGAEIPKGGIHQGISKEHGPKGDS